MASPTASTEELDALRDRAVVSASAGFAFLLVFGIVWIAAGALSYAVPADVAPWIYICGGLPGAPIAIALERKVAFARHDGPDPLLPLFLQLLFVQLVAFPAVMLVWSLAPSYTPVALAAVTGAHFLPYQWVYRTRIYGVLGFAVSAGAYVLGAVSGAQAIHHTGFFVGALLLAGAFLVRAHARRTWLALQRAQG